MNQQNAIKKFSPVYNAETFREAREQLGALLKLDGPASSQATARALNDQKYAAMLASLGHMEEWRNRLLNDPYNAKFAPTREEDVQTLDEKPLHSASALIKKAAQGMLKWGTTGFQTVEPWVMERRREACFSCDQLAQAPDTILYKAASAMAGGDTRICSACGCVVVKKTAMPDENCPLADPENPEMSRWGEPLKAAPGKSAAAQ